MISRTYKALLGMTQAESQVLAPQYNFLSAKNFIMNRELGSLKKRGGTKAYDSAGIRYGIGGYALNSGTVGLPTYTVPVQHRRSGSTSYIEKFDWSAESWSAITQGASTSFGAGPCSFAQVGDLFAIFAGRPAKITDIATGNVNRLGGPGPTAAATVAASAGAGSLTGRYSWKYTFYDSTSGWESSPSAVSSTLTLSSKNGELTALENSCAREGVDKKRIYRTQLTGEQPWYHVADVTLATTAYTDSIADASLGAACPDAGDNDPPPTTSYVGTAHERRIWIADGSDLYYSKLFDGSAYKLEQFSSDRKLSFNQDITALASAPSLGGQLVFKAPGFGISLVRGRTESDFEIIEYYPDVGTNFQSSVVTRGDFLFFWSDTGPTVMRNGQIVPEFDNRIANAIRDFLTGSYTSNPFVWAVWDHANKQLLVGATAADTGASAWFDTATDLPVHWIDTTDGSRVEWQV